MDNPLLELLSRGKPFCQTPDCQLCPTAPLPTAILCGSFNPLHAGHTTLAEVTKAIVGGPVAFEMSIANVDKPELAADEVARRLQQFANQFPVWVTRAPTFVEKSRLFPEVTMAVGFDTARRIVDAKYYGSERERDAALREIAERGCRFLVAGRLENGVFRSLDQIVLPKGLGFLFDQIPESAFRVDLSSTELRQGTK